MAITLAYGSTSVALRNPRQGNFRNIDVSQQRVRFTASGRKRVVEIGPERKEIFIRLVNLSQSEYDNLYFFLRGTLDWQVNDCTITDHHGNVHTAMTLILPDDGLRVEETVGNRYTVEMLFRRTTT